MHIPDTRHIYSLLSDCSAAFCSFAFFAGVFERAFCFAAGLVDALLLAFAFFAAPPVVSIVFVAGLRARALVEDAAGDLDRLVSVLGVAVPLVLDFRAILLALFGVAVSGAGVARDFLLFVAGVSGDVVLFCCTFSGSADIESSRDGNIMIMTKVSTENATALPTGEKLPQSSFTVENCKKT